MTASIPILRFSDPRDAGSWSSELRAEGRSIGFIPTMGALHEGHLSLVRRSTEENERTCVSIFVNPLQFNEASDLEEYPRDFEGDTELLAGVGCDMVFTGTLEQFFPEVPAGEPVPRENPGHFALGLEGAFRPGHFDGVATIVRRLFELVRPERAYFGAKDFQQGLVVQDLARRMDYPEVVLCRTSREADGLARSSRNLRLLPEERELALALSRALFAARSAWREGERDSEALSGLLRSVLDVPGVQVEYATVRDPRSWSETTPRGVMTRARAFVAAQVGPVRLIDNLALDTPEEGEEAVF